LSSETSLFGEPKETILNGFSSHIATLILIHFVFQEAISLALIVRDQPTNQLRGLSPRAKYTNRTTAACRRNWCQLLRIEECRMVRATDPIRP
jgi:hypothetical protein